jgi:hypothetical protein
MCTDSHLCQYCEHKRITDWGLVVRGVALAVPAALTHFIQRAHAQRKDEIHMKFTPWHGICLGMLNERQIVYSKINSCQQLMNVTSGKHISVI